MNTKYYQRRCLTAGRRAQGFAAFTLIELLVVIAIIGILASLLLPVLSRSKERGSRTACMNNFKQIMLATTIYAHDSMDKLPPSNGGVSPAPGWLYTDPNFSQPTDVQGGLLWRLVQAQKTYWCPMDRSPYTMTQGQLPRLQQVSSYCMNQVANGYTIDDFKVEAVSFWETDENAGIGSWNDGANMPFQGPTTRHGNGGVIACFDGHVEWIKQDEFTVEASKNPGRLYCAP